VQPGASGAAAAVQHPVEDNPPQVQPYGLSSGGSHGSGGPAMAGNGAPGKLLARVGQHPLLQRQAVSDGRADVGR